MTDSGKCTVLLTLSARPDSQQELVKFCSEISASTLERDGCIDIRLVRDDSDANRLVSIETWRSRADHEAYLAWRTERGDMNAVAGFVNAPPELAYYTAVEL
jgi:quinol monooxygenase YgiN